MAKVLSIGYLQDFLKKRNQVISSGGHTVTPASSVQQALDQAERGTFDVLVFGHGVPTIDRNFIAGHFKGNYPQISIIYLYDSHIEKAELADAILNVNGDPGDLVQTINYLCDRRPSSRSARDAACSVAVMLPSLGEILHRLM